MLVFLGKFENRRIKMLELTQLTSPKISIKNINMALGVRCDVDIFKLTARAQAINSESLYVLYFVKVLSVQF